MIDRIAIRPLMSALGPTPAIGARPAVTAVAAVRAVRSRDLTLSITTAEGDTVSLALHTSSDLTAVSYRGARRGHHHGRAGGFAVDAAQQSSVDLSVQGDLNAQERSDIASLVGRLGSVVDAFLSDHLDTAQRMLATFGDLGTVQGFTLEADQQQSVAVVAEAGPATGSPPRAAGGA